MAMDYPYVDQTLCGDANGYSSPEEMRPGSLKK